MGLALISAAVLDAFADLLMAYAGDGDGVHTAGRRVGRGLVAGQVRTAIQRRPVRERVGHHYVHVSATSLCLCIDTDRCLPSGTWMM